MKSICFDLSSYISILIENSEGIFNNEYPIVKAEIIFHASEHPNTILIANREECDYMFTSNGKEWVSNQ